MFYYKIALLIKEKRLNDINKLLFRKNCPNIIFNGLKKHKNIDKVFIFGSGYSINELTTLNFHEIDKNCSIGINKWIFHDFITTYYMIELTDDDDLNEKFRLRIIHLLKNKFKNPIFLIHRGRVSNPKKIKNWTKGMDLKRVFFYEYLRPDTFKKNIKCQFKKTLEIVSKKNQTSNVLTLGVGATLERAISLTILLRYSKIIILGIDLKNTKVFWSYNDFNFKGIESGQEAHGFHKTATNLNGRLPVQNSILIFDDLARNFYNSKILIATKNSLLSSKLEKFTWDTK